MIFTLFSHQNERKRVYPMTKSKNTYHARPEISKSSAKVYLWCGSKEPYAIKSHNILKKYLKNYEETIFDGYGHGEMLLKHRIEMCKRIGKALG